MNWQSGPRRARYLQAIQAAGEVAKTVTRCAKFRSTSSPPRNVRIGEDGRRVHDMYVYEVKKPSELKGEWDYYKLRAVIAGNEAFRS
jgi:branched-chain amino acid transport system substrate-binding protein